MDAKVVWKKGCSFTGSAAASGFSLPLGSETEAPEDGGFRPLELLLVGLAGCTGMDVISILAKKRQEVTSFEVRVHAERAPDHPKVFTRIEVDYILRGNGLDEGAVKRAAELSETKYCAAMATLRMAAPIVTRVSILP
jgi:putative redox protein